MLNELDLQIYLLEAFDFFLPEQNLARYEFSFKISQIYKMFECFYFEFIKAKNILVNNIFGTFKPFARLAICTKLKNIDIKS